MAALASKDFAAFTADELAEARVALSRLVWQPGAASNAALGSGARARASIFGARSPRASAPAAMS